MNDENTAIRHNEDLVIAEILKRGGSVCEGEAVLNGVVLTPAIGETVKANMLGPLDVWDAEEAETLVDSLLSLAEGEST